MSLDVHAYVSVLDILSGYEFLSDTCNSKISEVGVFLLMVAFD